MFNNGLRITVKQITSGIRERVSSVFSLKNMRNIICSLTIIGISVSIGFRAGEWNTNRTNDLIVYRMVNTQLQCMSDVSEKDLLLKKLGYPIKRNFLIMSPLEMHIYQSGRLEVIESMLQKILARMGPVK